MTTSLDPRHIHLAQTAAEIIAMGSSEEIQAYAQKPAAEPQLKAFLEWVTAGVSEQDACDLEKKIRSSGSLRQPYFYHSDFLRATLTDDRILTLLKAAPQDRALSLKLDLLTKAGWEPKLKAKAALARLAASTQDSGALVWLAERGDLPLQIAPSNDSTHSNELVCVAFSKESDRDLGNLERLTRLGIFADGDGKVGFTDFMAHNQMRCARKLAQLGFQPRDLVLETGHYAAGESPVVVYAQLVAFFRAQTENEQALIIGQMNTDLDALSAAGVSFAPPIQPSEEWLRDPFLASIANRARPTPSPTMLALYDALVKRGADPNHSELYLAQELQQLDWQDGETAYFENALRLGADPTRRPEILLSAICSWSGCMSSKALSWIDKLIALGADPSKIPVHTPYSEHPLAMAIMGKRFKLAKAAIARGVSPEWTGMEDGSSCLHLLADSQKKDAVALCAQIASDPRSKGLIDHKTKIERGGETALMLACAALNKPQIEALLNAGAHINEQDARGWTPLHHAGRKYGIKAQAKCAPVIALLLERGADPSLVNAAGLTPGQAMAKRAPIEGLAELMSVRPEDLTGPGLAAKKATEDLSKRGSFATSVVEKAILGAETSSEGPAPSNRKRSRL